MTKTLMVYPAGKICEDFLRVCLKSRKSLYDEIDAVLQKGETNARSCVLDKRLSSIESVYGRDDVMLLVTCEKERYLTIRDELIAAGWEEFKDFKWYKFVDRKVCLINANCHGPVLERYLNMQKPFTDVYAVHPFMAQAQYMKNGMHTPLDDNLIHHVDLLLYQHMLPDNIMSPTYSDENVLQKVKSDCQCVSIPNFYPLGGGFTRRRQWKSSRDMELMMLDFIKINYWTGRFSNVQQKTS